MSEFESNAAERAAEIERRCDIDIDTAREEAAWYSILNVLSLSLGSGMGIPLDQDETNSVFGGVGLCPAELPISNPAPLKAVYKDGDPHLTKQFEQRNFDTWRWSPDSFSRTLVPQAQGWTIVAETECAKWFGIPRSDEAISWDLHKEWTTNSLLLCALARKQCDFAFENLRDERGLFVMAAEQGSIRITDAQTNLEDQMCMLWAAADVASLAGGSDPMFADLNVQRRFLDRADDLFQAVADNKDDLLDASADQVLAQSIAICALVWYASCTQAQDLKARALWLLREFADNLVKAEDRSEMVGNTLVEAAAALRALADAFRVTRLRTYAESAARIFNFIESQWWRLPGVYSQAPMSNEYTYNVDDIGIITGALNASHLFLGERVNGGIAGLRTRLFFCNAVNLSGLQMSMPSPDFLPNWLQQREPSEHFRYGNLPLPSQIGIAPVFAGEVGYDPKADTWSRRMIFDAPAAMHTCCEFLWLNRDAVNGFPEIRLEEAPLAVRQAAGMEAG
jgi:hypothetical protein